MDYKWTRTGVNIEVTNTVYGMLEQGGICGEIEHYSESQINSLGYGRTDNLNDFADGEMATRLEMIRHHLQPHILRRGVRIV